MKVNQLIEALKTMPQNAHVWHLWDGATRTEINVVYEANDGTVVTSDYSQVCYSDADRPKSAPSKEREKYWYTPSDPNAYKDEDENAPKGIDGELNIKP